jgi:hypothetical protein
MLNEVPRGEGLAKANRMPSTLDRFIEGACAKGEREEQDRDRTKHESPALRGGSGCAIGQAADFVQGVAAVCDRRDGVILPFLLCHGASLASGRCGYGAHSPTPPGDSPGREPVGPRHHQRATEVEMAGWRSAEGIARAQVRFLD